MDDETAISAANPARGTNEVPELLRQRQTNLDL